MTSATFHGLSAGEQLGNLEYVVDDALLVEYRRLTGGAGHYPNLMADDCRALLLLRCRGVDLTTVWRRLELLRPPIAGRRVQVGGWLREIERRNGCPLLRVSAFAVDEIGTEILRSEAAFAVGSSAESLEPDVSTTETSQDLDDIAEASRIDFGELMLPDGSSLAAYRQRCCELVGVPSGDDGNGLTGLLAGWVEGCLGDHFGDDFRWGGQLSLGYLAPAQPGAEVAGNAVVVGSNRNADGSVTTNLAVSVFNSTAARIAVGNAEVTSPSPRLL